MACSYASQVSKPTGAELPPAHNPYQPSLTAEMRCSMAFMAASSPPLRLREASSAAAAPATTPLPPPMPLSTASSSASAWRSSCRPVSCASLACGNGTECAVWVDCLHKLQAPGAGHSHVPLAAPKTQSVLRHTNPQLSAPRARRGPRPAGAAARPHAPGTWAQSRRLHKAGQQHEHRRSAMRQQPHTAPSSTTSTHSSDAQHAAGIAHAQCPKASPDGTPTARSAPPSCAALAFE